MILLYTIGFLFLTITLYLIYFQLFKAKALKNDYRNARNSIDESKVKRGNIFDKNGLVLAYSEKTEDGYVRKNKYDYMYSTIIGYSSKKYGKTGIEATYNADLLNINKNKDIFTKIDGLIKPDNGNDVYLTIIDKLQSYAYDVLGDNKGSVIVSDPKTGKILAMISKPTFNVNNIESDWNKIINSKDGVLLNRPTQGLYEPGSIFKTVSSLAFLRSKIDLNYNDTGIATIGKHSVYNFEEASYGKMDLEKALNVSSNTYFYEKSQELTNNNFYQAVLDFGIEKKYEFPLELATSKIAFKENLNDIDKGNAAFGQGFTNLKPIDMMLVVNGIANDGKVYTPMIIDKIVRNGISQEVNSKILIDSVEPNYAKTIKSYMKSTAEYNDYYLRSGVSLASKTGTAENANNLYNSWYIAMAPAENPKYTVVITVEDTDIPAGEIAAPMGIKILDYALLNLEKQKEKEINNE